MPESTQTRNASSIRPAHWLLLSLSAAGTVLLLAWLLRFSHYGFDFTDESFYLVSIADPFLYGASATQFGFIYHPLYTLLNGNIAALRQANILITFCLAYCLSDVFLKTLLTARLPDAWSRRAVAAGLATGALSMLNLWLPTPNYNSLNLQALLLAATGLLLAKRETTRASVAGWLIIGLGGWLAFMAKPTTAAALALVAAAYLPLAGKWRLRLLALALASAAALLLASALLIDGSPARFVARLSGGMAYAEMLGSGHSLLQLLKLDELLLDSGSKEVLQLAAILIFFTAYCLQSASRALFSLGMALALACFALTVAITSGIEHRALYSGKLLGLLLCAPAFAAMMLGIVRTRLTGLGKITRPHWALALMFLAFPYVYAFGTNNSYWRIGAGAALFWILAGLVLLSPLAARPRFMPMLLSFGLATQLLSAAVILPGTEAPYRQAQPLRQHAHPGHLGGTGSTVLLSEEFAHYLDAAQHGARETGFRPGTPMIDLSGLSPGIPYALGARSVGLAWNIGGYPGSDALAAAALRKMPCDTLAAAWVLSEPTGPQKLSAEVLASFGADPVNDYAIVANWNTAAAAGGIAAPRPQYLLKPLRGAAAAIAACQASRKASQ